MLKTSIGQAKEIRNLIRRECCNYDKGYCLLLDDVERCRCIQEISCYGIYCNYFKECRAITKKITPLREKLKIAKATLESVPKIQELIDIERGMEKKILEKERSKVR